MGSLLTGRKQSISSRIYKRRLGALGLAVSLSSAAQMGVWPCVLPHRAAARHDVDDVIRSGEIVGQRVVALGQRVFESSLQGDHPRQAREIKHPANGRSARHNEMQLPSPSPQPLRQPEQQCHTGAVEVGDVTEIHHQPARLLPHGNTDL
jgi:hypothetical protein